jgi:hypothetical protein
MKCKIFSIALVRQQKPNGDHAATVIRDAGRPEVWFAFDNEADARKFGDAVQAESTETYSGWASQRAFELPVTKLAALESSLPAPKDNPRQREANGPRLSRRLRGGPRLPIKRRRGVNGKHARNPKADLYVVEIRDAARNSRNAKFHLSKCRHDASMLPLLTVTK